MAGLSHLVNFDQSSLPNRPILEESGIAVRETIPAMRVNEASLPVANSKLMSGCSS
jgi:hypothetical protein